MGTVQEAREALRRAEIAEAQATSALHVARAARLAATSAVRMAEGLAAKERERLAKLATDKARRDAKRLAAKLGVEIERHNDLESRPWFVSHPRFEDDVSDPYYGDHYVHSWQGVLERVKGYESALASL